MAVGPLDWSLVDGAVPLAVKILGALALAALILSRDRRWWTRLLPLAVAAAALLTLLVELTVDDWWQPFPDKLPGDVVVWLGVAILGVCLALFRMPTLRWRGRAGALLSGVLVVVLGLSEVNIHFDNYPTLRTMLGPQDTVSLKDATGKNEPTLDVPEGKALSDVWKAPAGLPGKGTVSTVSIPGKKSGFKARDAYVYLPPAYRASPRPLLPVLVLMAGQPGSPQDWITSGQLPDMMDDFAGRHAGLAPVVLVVDPLGSPFDNPLCMDSKLGNVQTYLADDVPGWAASHLQAAKDRAHWAVSGLSNGGTCALQMAVNAPRRYGTFLDISGQDEPTLGSRKETVDAAFGGDEAAYEKVNPMDVLARTKFPDTSGAVVAGTDDSTYRPQALKVYAAAKKAGMRVELVELPGGHSWQVWRPGLERQLPWLASRTGLTP
ncbi:esterase [Streptomyces venezuelae]|uniref:Esterase n=1 Tax=Streptomyces venezuelae TaxID=54571 RepID=A0A5P2CBS6_STRVZ|nr:alpha/beta hydrolase-fold protein [Streptomyces venezuelae]QES38771.1 esterase [Streptomyces venezuelae]